MGIVVNQSIKNTVITYLGFGIGAINVVFLYTKFLSDNYFGLITFILSTANILMPLMAFGTHNTIIKFYSTFKTRQSQNGFLTLVLFLPLLIILPLGTVGVFAYDWIGNWLSRENPIIKDYTWLIYISAITFAYFEVFYAWSKVHLHSVFGNFMKEVFHRLCITILLLALYLDLLNEHQLIYAIVVVYFLRMLIMKLYAFNLKLPVFKLVKIPKLKNVLKYSALIIIAGSIANIILEIDKFMIGQFEALKNVAYYGVAIYIATVIGVPSRSMHQITNPLTAKLLNDKNKKELKQLYQKSSINLFIVSGFIFLAILININQLYLMIPENYSEGFLVVFVIGLAKLSDNLIGNNNAILFNSDYYRVVLIFGIILALLTVLLNLIFIPYYGINGAAYASCITILFYNSIKLFFVYKKFKIQPFTPQTLQTLGLIVFCGLILFFWEFPFIPIVNIALKSLLLVITYGFAVYWFNISEEISSIIKTFITKKTL
ncbi:MULTISPECIES: lipopolysaccharide biosynthesis protein [Mesoflavibacter]|uniref:Polysaccharide biosynthesis C-terminal domain-containing protein n=1 Tax=Mesoflavibacter profundi TaxID=2708110 RepID=A0ABT4RXZ8_9FLAO|nr:MULTISPECIES: polysaccharide biosynthesis C-terminal domain-containing protein [Mesoflavibacter]MDA0176699.1 polysaccharide biosynthesis C-terminal domain-containing protein [Mesoflavibacter profundi]QIJ90356.1 Polysaccharide biosynthesis protein [Mesoflavibacter sp. HG96]QIJ93084.1 Polysaccharide biosynthesis protein [Mesoflavibacter sp. HG37]